MSLSDLRAQFAAAGKVAARLEQVAALEATLVADAQQATRALEEAEALQHLLTVPVEAMRDVTGASLRLEPLRRHGLGTVAAVHMASPRLLASISGISDAGAAKLKSIAQSMLDTTVENSRLDLASGEAERERTAVLQAVHGVEAVRAVLRNRVQDLSVTSARLREGLAAAAPTASRLRWWLSSSHHRRAAIDAASNLAVVLGDPTIAVLLDLADRALTAYEQSRATAVHEDFRQRPTDYYAVLEDVTGRGARLTHTHFDDELLARIEDIALDTSGIRATLRKYQVFGTKFALAQGRVLLGDEMGLGKTLQAITVLHQRQNEGAVRFLVVCPASVLINWQREITTRSGLAVAKLHGDTLVDDLDTWQQHGGIGLTTFDMLKTLPFDDGEIAALDIDTVVVDEAHYAKNPGTGRARVLKRWLDAAPRVLLMTGTPLENRVEEFVALASLLDGQFASQLNHTAIAVGADAFRTHAAPVYLRRNADDVLNELPALTRVDEFCTWDGADHEAYVQAVAAGNFMAMRQAGMRPVELGRMPSKLERLTEIAEEAFAEGKKVLVFSYFRHTLQLVSEHLGTNALGPITGDVPAATRQALVDEFTAATAPLALLGQIQAAGTGLNLQAASVVILCEPQIKPSLEVQAIARAHRMGQLRKVQVHRLVIPDSVDDVMLRLLKHKQDEFDAFARESSLADAVADAKDQAEAPLARAVIASERERLHLP